MEDVVKELKRIKEIELTELKNDKNKGIPIRINPNSYYAKEIEYQTIILKEIQKDIAEIKRLLTKSNL